MLISCTLKDNIVYLPTVAKTEAGFYMSREPVDVVPAANTDGLRRAINDVLARGNAIIPTPKRNAYPPPVLPKYAGLKSWSAFMRGASEWKIAEKNGNYQITPYRKDPKGGQSWVADTDRRITFPPGTPVNKVVDRMIAILQDAARGKTETAK
jgi:hypothetical protein